MVDVTFNGPLFSGQFPAVMEDILMQSQEEVGNAVLERVQYHLDVQIKHPTPYYETQIIQQRVGQYEVVHDRGIIYGPWLEGTSARNARSHFKGYASFRKAKDEVIQQIPDIVNAVIRRNLGRLGA